MEKIKTIIIFEGSRKRKAWITGLIVFLVGVLLYWAIKEIFWLDFESNILGAINYHLIFLVLSILTYFTSWNFGYVNCCKEVLFTYNNQSKKLIIRKDEYIYDNVNVFKVDAEIQTRVPITRFQTDSKKFFCLKIINQKNGNETSFCELIEDKSLIPSDIKTNPVTQISFLVPMAVERFPGPIFKLYKLLKENHLDNT